MVECILCSIAQRDSRVESLEIVRIGGFIISANLYPYNPGHLMVFPIRHMLDIRDLKDHEVLELFHCQRLCLSALEELYQPHGFNVGYNLGEESGGSIAHFHLHIVPRYRNETGFLDLLSDTRIYVENPRDTVEKVKKSLLRKIPPCV